MKPTSIEAHKQIIPDLNRQQQILLRHFKFWMTPTPGFRPPLHGYTCERLSLLPNCELTYEQIKRRMGELEKRGLVIDSGQTAKTTSGRSAIIWRVVDNSDKP